jgi:hypothetical protein
MAMSAYIKNKERSQVNDLLLHLKLLEKQEQAKSKTSRRKKMIQRISKTKSWFFEKINNIDKSLVNPNKRGGKTPN